MGFLQRGGMQGGELGRVSVPRLQSLLQAVEDREKRSGTRRPSISRHRGSTAPTDVGVWGSEPPQAGEWMCGPSSAVLALNVPHGREIKKPQLEGSRWEQRRQTFLLRRGHFGSGVLQS